MAEHSEIEWTDATWNPVTGCTKVSPGCKYCYAETFAERFRGVEGHPYEQGFDLKLWPERLVLPFTWRKPKRIFVNSMSDLFHEKVPTEFIDKVFGTMDEAHWHRFQVLTKRAERMKEYIAGRANRFGLTLDVMSPHVWLGVSVESQEHIARA
jgi:protein gp37